MSGANLVAAISVMYWSVAVMYWVVAALHILAGKEGSRSLVWYVLAAAWLAGGAAWYFIGLFFPPR